MEWVLVEKRAADSVVRRHALRAGQANWLTPTATEDGLAIADVPPAPEEGEGRYPALACITLAGWGVKLEALGTLSIHVHPATARTEALAVPNQEQYTLTRPEIILLRPNDTISFPSRSSLAAAVSLTLQCGPSAAQVEVKSSVAADVEVLGAHGKRVIGAKPEQRRSVQSSETEDEDEDLYLDRGFPIATATPIPVLSHSETVQETPTANRAHTEAERLVADAPTDASAVAESVSESTITDTSTSHTPKCTEDADATATSTPPISTKPYDGSSVPEAKPSTRTSPIVLIKETAGGIKRKSDAALSPDETPARAKRGRKSSGDVLDRLPSATKASLSRRPTLGTRKGRNLGVEGTPLGPNGSNTVVADAEGMWQHNGPPLVAFSNSSLSQMPNLMKFLRQHGGSATASVTKGKCNLLCVREGPLRKSMKLLSCVALGIPIVTDKWLSESAQKKRLLDPKLFMPRVPDQEREWGFSLGRVWGSPQSNMFGGLTVHFTPALRHSYSDFKEVEALCLLVGARVDTRPVEKAKNSAHTVFLAMEATETMAGKDPDCKALLEKGWTVYSRDVLTASILRGSLQLDSDEFMIKETVPKQRGPRRGSLA